MDHPDLNPYGCITVWYCGYCDIEFNHNYVDECRCPRCNKKLTLKSEYSWCD